MGLRGDEYVLSAAVPDWVPDPLARVLADLTYNEAHAALLGLVGAPLAVAWTTAGVVGRLAVATVGVLLAAIALVRVPDRTLAARLIARETWYFCVVFVLAAASAWVVVGVMA